MIDPPVLRDYQAAAIVELLRSYINGKRAPLLVMPTGAGKTVIIAEIMAAASARGRRSLIVTHCLELTSQASTKLHDAYVRHGVMGPDNADTEALVQVASIQKLVRCLDSLPRFNLIVLDEAHHATAGQWQTLLQSQLQAYLLGVTATPERLDGHGLGVDFGGPFDDPVLGPTAAELINGGFLVPSRVFAPSDLPDLSGVRIVRGDFDGSALAAAMERPALVGDAIGHYREHAAGLPTIAFCVNLRHAALMAEGFRAAGFAAIAVSGGMAERERDAALAGLADGTVQVICAVDLISEGRDIPNVGAVILLRPTQSLTLYMQQVGRGLRPAQGKEALVVLDHAGNSLLHGLPETPHPWSLSGQAEARQPTAVVRACVGCGLVQASGRACVECGELVPKAIPPPVPRVTAGQLKELGRIAPTMSAYAIKNGIFSKAELRVIARKRGYKRGWVRHKLREQAARAAE